METTRRLSGILAIGLVIASSPAHARPPGHGPARSMSDRQLQLHCRLDDVKPPVQVDADIQLPSATADTKLDQAVNLPAPLPPIRLKRYLPRAKLVQHVQPDDSKEARPAVQISIVGPVLSFDRWLIADDPARNRLTSLIGTWRYLSVANRKQRGELLQQFKKELTRGPRIVISQLDGSDPHELPATAGEVHVFKDLGCTVRVRVFHPHFGMDLETGKPVNQSDRRLNPAALVEIGRNGKTEERWVFAKFPDFKKDAAETIPYRIRLDCPLERQRITPDFVVLTTGRAAHEVWMRYGDEASYEDLAVGQMFKVRGSQYEFRISRFEPSANLTEEYQAGGSRMDGPALQVETSDAAGAPVTLWLELGRQRAVSTVKGSMTISFGPVQAGPHGGHGGNE